MNGINAAYIYGNVFQDGTGWTWDLKVKIATEFEVKCKHSFDSREEAKASQAAFCKVLQSELEEILKAKNINLITVEE